MSYAVTTTEECAVIPPVAADCPAPSTSSEHATIRFVAADEGMRIDRRRSGLPTADAEVGGAPFSSCGNEVPAFEPRTVPRF